MSFSHKVLTDFTTRVFLKMGFSQADADLAADVLVSADLRGISSHGVFRLNHYAKLWQEGRINATPNIRVTHETPSTAVVNGDLGIGAVVGPKSMEIAIEKARNVGSGWVATGNSNHYGIAGYHAMMALDHDMIGISMTNANALVAPTYSMDRLLGTNPIAVAIPAGNHPPFVADLATTAIAHGKLMVLAKKGFNAPDGLVQDVDGNMTIDPWGVKKGGCLVPLGGDAEHGSHKGYCMAAIVDIFSALLSGAEFGPFVPPLVPFLNPDDVPTGSGAGTGHFFGAFRIDAFQPADKFKQRMDEWIETFKNSKTIKGQERVLIPGDPEREMEAILKEKGVDIADAVLKDLESLSKELDVEFFA